MRRITLNFIDGNIQVPIVKFTSNGKDFYALFDTGAECTMMNKAVLERYPDYSMQNRVDVDQSVIGFHGEGTNDAIWADIHIGFETDTDNKAYLDFNCTVLDMSNLAGYLQKRFDHPIDLLMIAGFDFMTEHKAKIDMAKRTMSMLVKG